MGKTKTTFVDGTDAASDGEKSTKDKYLEKRAKQAATKGAKNKEPKLDKKGRSQVTKVGLKGGERIKTVGADMAEIEKEEISESKSKRRKSKQHGKKYKEVAGKVDREKLYELSDAVKLVKETSYSKFDGTVELHILLRKNLTVNVDLPHDTGKSRSIEFADDKTIEKLKKGNIDFDVLLATAEMMPRLVPFAKILGPKGLMPNPKTGTLVKTKADAKKFSADTLTLKTQKNAHLLHVSVGKVSQKTTELSENVNAIFSALGSAKVLSAHLAPTMGPSVRLVIS